MPTPQFPELKAIVEGATEGLRAVELKRLFGCDGFFAGGTIFSMIWKEGRIGLKLRDEGDYDALMKMKGAGPWCPSGKMKMSGWVLVAPVLHDADKLAPWIAKAHAQAVGAPKKPAKKKKLAANKTPAKKRRV